jgi:hypothetical protein
VTNAGETQTLEEPKRPAVMLDHGAGQLSEIKDSLAKKSGTGELRNVRFSGWANDGVRIKVKTLEALFIEAPRVHADISKPALRRERKEPVTQTQETQLPEAPRTASVGTAQGDQLLQKESLAKSSVSMDFAPNVPIQHCANTGSSVQHRERRLEKILKPLAVAPSALQKRSRLKQTRENRTRFSLQLPVLGSELTKMRGRQLNRQCRHLSSPRVLQLRQNKAITWHRHCEVHLPCRSFGRSTRR